MLNTGAYIGMIIGFLSGLFVSLIVFTITKEPSKDLKTVSKLFAQIGAVPTLMFGGNWISSKLLADRWCTLFDSYVKWLAILFFVLVTIPTIVWFAREVKKQITE
jgi:hypothetical protein